MLPSWSNLKWPIIGSPYPGPGCSLMAPPSILMKLDSTITTGLWMHCLQQTSSLTYVWHKKTKENNASCFTFPYCFSFTDRLLSITGTFRKRCRILEGGRMCWLLRDSRNTLISSLNVLATKWNFGSQLMSHTTLLTSATAMELLLQVWFTASLSYCS